MSQRLEVRTCQGCHENCDDQETSEVKVGKIIEVWCSLCTEQTEPCVVCTYPVDRMSGFEVTKGVNSVVVCEGDLVEFAARSTCQALRGEVPRSPLKALKV